MKKVFFAAPFYQWLMHDSRLMAPRQRAFVEDVIALIENHDCQVFNAHRREAYGADWMSPTECSHLDLIQIKESENMVAVPGSPPSGGVQVELGWASALGKPILLLLEHHETYSSLVEGLPAVAPVRVVRYRDTDHCLELLPEVLRAWIGTE